MLVKRSEVIGKESEVIDNMMLVKRSEVIDNMM